MLYRIHHNIADDRALDVQVWGPRGYTFGPEATPRQRAADGIYEPLAKPVPLSRTLAATTLREARRFGFRIERFDSRPSAVCVWRNCRRPATTSVGGCALHEDDIRTFVRDNT